MSTRFSRVSDVESVPPAGHDGARAPLCVSFGELYVYQVRGAPASLVVNLCRDFVFRGIPFFGLPVEAIL